MTQTLKLTSPAKLQSFAVIIRCTWSKGDDQRACLAELHSRGLWLADGSNGDDQQAMAIRAAGRPVPAEKRERQITLMALGYCSPKAQAFIDMYVAGIQRTPEAYKENVRAWPEYHAAQLVEGLGHDEIAIMIKDAKAEARLLAKHGF